MFWCRGRPETRASARRHNPRDDPPPLWPDAETPATGDYGPMAGGGGHRRGRICHECLVLKPCIPPPLPKHPLCASTGRRGGELGAVTCHISPIPPTRPAMDGKVSFARPVGPHSAGPKAVGSQLTPGHQNLNQSIEVSKRFINVKVLFYVYIPPPLGMKQVSSGVSMFNQCGSLRFGVQFNNNTNNIHFLPVLIQFRRWNRFGCLSISKKQKYKVEIANLFFHPTTPIIVWDVNYHI